jgi:xanthine dehydrogenase YagR molybdenum-binding subunit
MKPVIGAPLDRTDGVQKVTGGARYAAEFALPGLCHACIVQSTIARGRIAALDVTRAEHAPGVLVVMTHENAPRLPQAGRGAVNPPAGRVLSLLQDADVHYNGEPVAVVVAGTFEQAVAAADLVRVMYATDVATLDFNQARARAYAPAKLNQGPVDSKRGDAAAAYAAAEVRVEATYTTPMQHHNPMEPHATIAHWQDGKLTLHDSTQYVSGVRDTMAKVLGIDAANVRVISPFVGGGFGCKGSMWTHVALAAMCAREVKRPVKLALARWQMFGPVGGRPRTEQRIALGATRDGRLTSIRHAVISHTSAIEDFVEPASLPTRILYACPNVDTSQRLVKLDVGTPTFQRAPGESTGTFAIEVALDELAYALAMDPMELRLRNHADVEPQSGKPWSSKHLRECYAEAAKRFGWSRRDPRPGSMRDRDAWIGYGMATATYPANRQAAQASTRLWTDGTFVVASGSQELGTGTYTVMTQVAAQSLGVSPNAVRFLLGDTALPRAPVSGGSTSAASVGPAVKAACDLLRERILAAVVRDPQSAHYGVDPATLAIDDGVIVAAGGRGEPLAVFAGRRGVPLDAAAEARPGDEKATYASHSFGAVFAEVRIDPWIGRLRIPRIVATYDVGTRLNAKTALSQLRGGLVWGVGFAVTEESLLDVATGHFANASLAEYHVPVNADIGELDVTFVDVADTRFNPLGIRGIGEIGITGVAAAIDNAVFHACGVRVRDLPITVDKFLAQASAGARSARA